jgi:hypothetical protein
VATFFTIDRANERIPEVREILLLLRAQRGELIELRDRYLALTGDEAGGSAVTGTPARHSGDEASGRQDSGGGDLPMAGGDGSAEEAGTLTGLERAELIQLRIKGIVDQMGASVARIDAWGITLRDIESGLIDFPALVDGRQVWLCWRLGEDDVAWWHDLDSGFGGRRPLAELGVTRGVD